MPEFTQDWSAVRAYWPEMFAEYGLVGKPNLAFLEIGCFEGMATRWLLENVLTGEGARITVIDTFRGSDEFGPLNIRPDGMYRRFHENLADYIKAEKVTVRVGASQRLLRIMVPEAYDFVYVDGSHDAWDVLEDAVLSWDLLRPGGLMVFDDSNWEGPKAALDAFLPLVPDALLRYADYQLVIQKEER